MPGYVADQLTKDERMKIYKWSGEGYTAGEISRMFNKDRPMRAPKLRAIGVEKILLMPGAGRYVSKFRLDFLKEVKDIPVADKKVRLYDLETIRQRSMQLLGYIRPERNKEEFKKFLDLTKKVIEVSELARNEMEQRPGMSIGIGLQGEMLELTDEQLQEQHDELIRRAQRAIEQRITADPKDPEGVKEAGNSGSAEVLLATSEELRRDKLRERDLGVSDV